MADTAERIPELGNRTWEELEVVTHDDGHLLFKDFLRRKKKDGTFEMVEVRVRIVRMKEIAQARAEARSWLAELKLDEEKDRDIFDELEQVCILSHAIRDKEKPWPQHQDFRNLVSMYDEASLQDILGRIEELKTRLDPRVSLDTPDDVWTMVQRVAKAGHLAPLTDIAGHEQTSFVVFMASQAMKSPTGAAWLLARENSTPERSPVQSSTES
jgi:uncharacterized protein YutE (UPF0331/DUF86 family)